MARWAVLTAGACALMLAAACTPVPELRPGLNGTYAAPGDPSRRATIRFDRGTYGRAECRVMLVEEVVVFVPLAPERFSILPGLAFGFVREGDDLKLLGVVNCRNGGIMPSTVSAGMVLRKQGGRRHPPPAPASFQPERDPGEGVRGKGAGEGG